MSRSVVVGLLLILVTACNPMRSGRAPQFVEETSAGLSSVYDGGWEFYVGGGVAAFDCSGDGRPDLFFAGGSNPSVLYRNVSATGGPLRFVRQANSGVELTGVVGAYPIDIDGDGVLDLVVLRVGETVLFRGRGDCTFERANERWGFDGGNAWTTAFSAPWEAGANWPTLAIGNYVDRNNPGSPFGTCHDNFLFRPAPSGRGFAAPTRLTPGYCALSMLFTDWNRSAQADLMVANDRQYYRCGEEQLWRIRPGQRPVLYGRSDGWEKLQIWGMGIASYDLTGDGYPSYFLSSMADNKLRIRTGNKTQPTYTDSALPRGVTAQRPYTGGDTRPSTAWHAEFGDVDNDGLIDLFIAKGNVEAMTDAAQRDPSNLLLGQPDGRFIEGAPAAGIVSFARARGAALVDFNLDGMLDLVVVNRKENVKLWRNIGQGPAARPRTPGNWVELRLRQVGGNRDAVGAGIGVDIGGRTLRREVTVGGSHSGGQLGWVHFGLGAARLARVRVQWPHGDWGPWLSLAANHFTYVERGPLQSSDQMVPWQPPRP